jgi:hypothetical protein
MEKKLSHWATTIFLTPKILAKLGLKFPTKKVFTHANGWIPQLWYWQEEIKLQKLTLAIKRQKNN